MERVFSKITEQTVKNIHKTEAKVMIHRKLESELEDNIIEKGLLKK